MAWVDISNARVAAGAAVETSLMTQLRDNVPALAAREAGAPKILGNPYDYQEFLASGTWTKPANAESGDVVFVQIVGGGGSGQRTGDNLSYGGGGGGGAIHRYDDIDMLGSTEDVVVGAGGAAGSGSGSFGGSSTFGTRGTTGGIAAPFLQATGGGGGNASNENDGGQVRHGTLNYSVAEQLREAQIGKTAGGDGAQNDRVTISEGAPSIFGGGGGGRAGAGLGTPPPSSGGFSCYAGNGGDGTPRTGNIDTVAIDGEFPGGGGGAVQVDMTGDTVGGAGGDGVVRVWCIKEE